MYENVVWPQNIVHAWKPFGKCPWHGQCAAYCDERFLIGLLPYLGELFFGYELFRFSGLAPAAPNVFWNQWSNFDWVEPVGKRWCVAGFSSMHVTLAPVRLLLVWILLFFTIFSWVLLWLPKIKSFVWLRGSLNPFFLTVTVCATIIF